MCCEGRGGRGIQRGNPTKMSLDSVRDDYCLSEYFFFSSLGSRALQGGADENVWGYEASLSPDMCAYQSDLG